MNRFSNAVLGTLLLATQCVHADTVIEEVPDTLTGKALGGVSGFMVGAAVGGPVGAIGIGLASAWLGGKAQEETGLHGVAYRIRRDDGAIETVRSPLQRWAVGDMVRKDGNRLAYMDK